MTIIANLDAEIEAHHAEVGHIKREIQIFGRVWPMIPSLNTVTINPLMQMIGAAQIANDPNKATMAEQMMAIQMLGQINEVLTMVIAEEFREEFRAIIDKKGIPVQIIEKVIEAVMVAFDAAPFHSGVTSSSPDQVTPTPPPVSTTGSGNSPEEPGSTSMQNSPASPRPVGLTAGHSQPTQNLQPYERQTVMEDHAAPQSPSIVQG
jgi:hypothetical protein